jgi:hypothetical protein
MKKCSSCKISKEYIDFYKRKDSKDGFTGICKNCTSISNKKYNLENKVNNNKYHKEYRLENKEKIKESRKEYYIKNKEKLNKKNKNYRINNREKLNNIQVEKRKNNILFKLKYNTRNLILNSIKKQGYSKKSRTYEILGCSFEEFKTYIEIQFTKGMSWENHGEWHYDHIIPISFAKNQEEIIKLNHYTNFQPLWAKDNLSKGNKIVDNTQLKLI